MKFIDNNNRANNKKATIISALVDEGLTLIIQVPDVAVNKIFKQGLKQRYYSHRAELQIEVGTKLKITKEKIIEFILETINDINTQSKKQMLIHGAFKYCGMNPWSSEKGMKELKEHLEDLESNNILKAMILSNQEVVQLE
jgi:hypothetical protein